jgi:cytochrome P450
LFALLTDDAQREAVAADRSLVPQGIEEALRWESPVQFVSRTPTKDTEIAGVPIGESESVTLCLGSANRDDSHFREPDRFDVSRPHNDHVAFSEGPHRCLGEHLARLEVTTAVNVLLDRLGDMRLDPGDLDPHVHGSAFRSPTSLPVVFTKE